MPKKYSTHKRRQEGWLKPLLPPLMEMDGLTAPRLAFLFHAGLWLPAPHEKHLLSMVGSPVFAFAQ